MFAVSHKAEDDLEPLPQEGPGLKYRLAVKGN